MPGFAKQAASSSASTNADFFNVDDVADKTFYGFRYNHLTGKLQVEKINDGDVVSLPDPSVVDANDYKQWVWTRSNLSFSWNNSRKTHLLVEVR
jgi:hypothetical protein